MTNRPIIVGFFNPHSPDPIHALYPAPKNSAGYRLHRMVADVDAEVGKHYVHLFDRRNLYLSMPKVLSSVSHECAARVQIGSIAVGSTVVLLGHTVVRAFSDALSEPIKRTFFHPQVIDGVTWRTMPHPSGRCLSYNDPVFRRLAGMLLADLARE